MVFFLQVAAASAGQSKVHICHFPPGNPGNFQQLVVAAAAVPAHLAHGDRMGDCPCRSDDDCAAEAFC